MTIEEYLTKVCTYLGLEAAQFELKVDQLEDRIEIALNVDEDLASAFIGSQGETLYALEYLTRLTFKDEHPEKSIILDVNDYRAQKEESLIHKAKRLAQEVLEQGHPMSLNYLNSYERYLVHQAIGEDPEFSELETFSQDGESGRELIIGFKE